MEPDVDRELNEALGRLQDAVDDFVVAIKREWTDFLNRWAEGLERRNADAEAERAAGDVPTSDSEASSDT